MHRTSLFRQGFGVTKDLSRLALKEMKVSAIPPTKW
jgi:hypothetical protein